VKGEMVPKNSDTDPSTPTARRPSSRAPGPISATAETQPEGIPAPGKVEAAQADQTDPGVGPPAPMRSLPPQVVGVVVPSPAVAGPSVAAVLADAIAESPDAPSPPMPSTAAKQDSVELLLSGISGPRPARARTTPQTGGQASAVYHTEHELHAGQPLAGPPKHVAFERPMTPRAIPVAAAAARRAAQRKSAPVEPTVVTERALARRLVVAFVGALVVVAALFVVSQMTKLRSADRASAPPPAPPLPAQTAAQALPSAAPPESPSAAESAASTDPPAASAETPAPEPSAAPERSTTAAARGVPASTAHPLIVPSLVHRRQRISVSASPAPSGNDVGEFKTTF
jgi:hypothetical protein